MTSLLECNARAALCRQLARLEPAGKNLWLAEAANWSHLTQQPKVASRHDEPAESWCWKAIRKRKPLDVKWTEVQFEFRNAAKTADGDAFEELLRGLTPEDSGPN
jgi:hypothetical protein